MTACTRAFVGVVVVGVPGGEFDARERSATESRRMGSEGFAGVGSAVVGVGTLSVGEGMVATGTRFKAR